MLLADEFYRSDSPPGCSLSGQGVSHFGKFYSPPAQSVDEWDIGRTLRTVQIIQSIMNGHPEARIQTRGYLAAVIISVIVSIGTQATEDRKELNDCLSWTYQLQNPDVDVLASDPTSDLVVIDYSKHGDDDSAFTREEILKLQDNGKFVAAYFSIGEAEDYRFYWDDKWNAPDNRPNWLGPENPDWQGNFLVRFWEDGWKQILFSYLTKIESAGFDAVYLDKVDAYYDWMVHGGAGVSTQHEMIILLRQIKMWTEALRPGGMKVIIQNGETLLIEEGVTDGYENLFFLGVDAVATEDLYYQGDLDMDNELDPAEYRFPILDKFVSRGLPVFSVEYLNDHLKKWHFYNDATRRQYIPLVAGRELDRPEQGIKIVERIFWDKGELSYSTVTGRLYRLRQSTDIKDRGINISQWSSASSVSRSVRQTPDFSESIGFIFLEIDLFPRITE